MKIFIAAVVLMLAGCVAAVTPDPYYTYPPVVVTGVPLYPCCYYGYGVRYYYHGGYYYPHRRY